MNLNPRWVWTAAVCAAALSTAAMAQTAPATAEPSGSKKELSQRVVQLQTPGIEGMARQLVEIPAQQLLGNVQLAVQQRVAESKRQAVWQQIEGDARRYVEDATPIVRDRALKVAPEVVGPILESRLTDDELRQVVQVLQSMESPAFRKYNSLMPEMFRALNERVVTDTRGTIEPKVRAMQESATKRFNQAAQPAPGAAAQPAAAPAKKQ
jgi:hypothetical protein